ncbi:hypothetical protein BBP40_004291 [Aspergillus hancockii]|nr:hypothetical protein BBP40_004291 [Aspergillus hancockii]
MATIQTASETQNQFLDDRPTHEAPSGQSTVWEQRAAKYCSEVNGERNFEFLRSKYAQLRRGISRLRAVHRKRSHLSPSTAQLIHHRQERALNDLSTMQVPNPPILELKTRSQAIQAMLLLIERHQRDQSRPPPPVQVPQMNDVRWNDFAAAPLRNQTPG